MHANEINGDEPREMQRFRDISAGVLKAGRREVLQTATLESPNVRILRF
jgi:hypothetical protein